MILIIQNKADLPYTYTPPLLLSRHTIKRNITQQYFIN